MIEKLPANGNDSRPARQSGIPIQSQSSSTNETHSKNSSCC